jgi:FAD/FMN-containing dehydrogenase
MSVSETTVQQFRGRMRGEVLVPGDPGFDHARTIWNAMIDRRPAVIARCMGVADVQQSVRFGREQNLTVAVRGGGHNIAGNAVCDGGLMVDLSAMRHVTIDPDTRRAYVGPGATLHDFDHEAQAFALATPIGINSTTGVAGLTLGGGFGWLTRKYGLTVDSLLSAHVVTADGRFQKADEDENAELFWALRGGGGNFGIVTLFDFALHPVGPEVLAGLMVFPPDRGILQQYRAFVEHAPDELSVWVVVRKAPPLPFLPAAVHGQDILALAVCYAGEIDEGQRLIAPLRTFGTVLGEHIGPVPYEMWQQAFDPMLTPGARNYWKSHNFSTLPDDLLDLVVEYGRRVPSPHCEVFIGQLGGRATQLPEDSTAYPHRNAGFVMNVHGRWQTAPEDRPGIEWARGFFNASSRFATGGVYVNFMTQDETDRVGAAYGKHYDRLVKIKDRYDPDNVFSMNQNIRPSARQAAGRVGA